MGNSALFIVTLGESTTLADQYADAVVSGGTTYNETLAESLTLADTMIALQVMPAAITDTVTLSDGATVGLVIGATLSDAITLADALGATQVMVNGLSETVTVAYSSAGTVPGSGVWPDPADVKAGVQYGPTGTEYTGTKQGGGSYLRRR